MPPNPEATSRRLVSAAERLFAERGIDGVSLREINSAAGQRNSTALQYHFRDRAGLLGAVLRKHQPEIEVRRHQLLDDYESRGPLPGAEARRALAAALVRPLAAKLSDPDGGRAYLRIMEQLVHRHDPPVLGGARDDPGQSVNRWRELVAPLIPQVAVHRLHQRFMAIRVTYVELARRADGPAGRGDRLFTSHLIDVVSAVLATEVSEETARLLAERDAGRRANGSGGEMNPGDTGDNVRVRDIAGTELS
ncbi:putative transcriptional regulator, TetR family protein [Microtetraspora sp. NBRC 13810]|uniref:helix-turn-helix domain-containing protein n=1 Tax=Microtetraspora sp. NBRC 13810 TaxID=3030990 RepID=UPI0024A5A8CC|nr:helix-turn-helix domain-containing protein [Microtetraspora sp. NBRC 13810]GLW12810.1 putative transcriptional regulator, TetR family protein [Microtetraspora sp. NBRC 13810]